MATRNPSRFEPTSNHIDAKIGDNVELTTVEHSPGPPGKGNKGDKGDKGDPGDPGLPGPQGDPGIDFNQVYDQPIASIQWDIIHNAGKHPSVVIVDTSGRSLRAAIQYPTLDRVVITFSVPVAGQAYLN